LTLVNLYQESTADLTLWQMGHREILCMVETPPPSLPSDCQKRVWPNDADTFRPDHLPPACHLLPWEAQ